MNVLGAASTTPRSLITPTSAIDFHFFSLTFHRRASSSTTSNPTLCRVPLYSSPGFPSPTTAFIQSAIRNQSAVRNPQCLLLLLLFLLHLLALFLFLLALL